MMVKKNVRYGLDRKFMTMVQSRYRGKTMVQKGPLFKKGFKFYFTKKEY